MLIDFIYGGETASVFCLSAVRHVGALWARWWGSFSFLMLL